MLKCTKEKELLCKKKNKICNKKTGRCNKIHDIQIINKIQCTKEKELLCKNKNKICNKKTGRCNKIHDIKVINNNKKSLTTLEKISKLKKIWKKVKLNSNNNPKKKAFNIIIKHLLPFITKTFTLKNRIKYANEIHKGLFKDFNLKELKSLNIPADKFKIITKDNYYLNNIHLFKKIGSESVYGTIYNVKYKYNKYFYNI